MTGYGLMAHIQQHFAKAGIRQEPRRGSPSEDADGDFVFFLKPQ